LAGVLARPTFRLEVWKTGSPVRNGTLPEGDYIYLTKIHSIGQIGERSIGLPVTDLGELLSILKRLESSLARAAPEIDKR
jgi:hypothetical protein